MAKVKIIDIGDGSERAKPRRYESMMDAWDDIRNARIVEGLMPQQILERFNPQCKKKFKLQTLTKAFIKMGVNKAIRRMRAEERVAVKRAIKGGIRHARAVARHNAFQKETSRAVVESGAAEAIVDRMIARKKAAAEKHFDRMDAIVERAHETIEKFKPSKKNLGIYLNNADKVDEIARRTYGIADEKPVTPHQLQIGILLSMNGSQSTEG